MDKGQEFQANSPSQSYYGRRAAEIAGREDKIDDLEHEDLDLNAGQLAILIAFDDSVKEMASFKNVDPSEKLTKEQRKKYYAARGFLVFFYFIVVPFCQSPAWCLEYYHQQGYRNFGMFDCDAVSVESRVRYSAFPTFSPMVTILIDVFCMVAFCIMACYEKKWKNQTEGEKRRAGILIVAVVISMVDLTRCFFSMKFPYFANMMRVIVILTFTHRLR